MNKETPLLQLFELVLEDGTSFSPYAWRVRLALDALRLPYETTGVGFADITTIGDGQFATVPVLQDADLVLGESWAIAEHLDERYGGGTLLGSAREKQLIRFFDRWCRHRLLAPLTRICVLDILMRLHPADRDYFRHSREARLGAPLEQIVADRHERLAAFRLELDPLRSTLLEAPFIGGDTPSYADFIGVAALVWAGTVSTIGLLEPDDPLLAWFDRCLAATGNTGPSLTSPGLQSASSRNPHGSL